MGKTNLDQFACGLVGTRTPYGVPANAFDDRCAPHSVSVLVRYALQGACQ